MNRKPLIGKHALITGGSRGIGRAIVLALADAGASVSFIYNTADDAATELVALARGHGCVVTAWKFDLADCAGLDMLVSNIVDKIGSIDILVHNAGIRLRTEFLTSTKDDWDRTFALNLRSVYFLSQTVAKTMIANHGGTIVSVASPAGQRHVTTSIEYGLSKAGIVYLTGSFAQLLAPWNIRVNAVAPGRTYTDMTGYDRDPAKETYAREHIPLGHINTSEEVARVVLFLVSDASENMTGQVLTVDGGESVC